MSPVSQAFLQMSFGNVPCSSSSAATGTISLRANSRAVSMSCFSSSEKSKLGMARVYLGATLDALRSQAHGDRHVGVFGGSVAERPEFVRAPAAHGTIGGEQHAGVAMSRCDRGDARNAPRRRRRLAKIVVPGAELAGSVVPPTG